MRFIGLLMFVAGIILLGIAFTMDTSVPTNYSSGNEFGLPERVNNIGLMADKQNYLIFGALLTILGVITIIKYDKKIEKEESEKVCPKCAEKVKKNALVCRFCGNSFEEDEAEEEEENFTMDANILHSLNYMTNSKKKKNIEKPIERTNNHSAPKIVSQNKIIKNTFFNGNYEIIYLEFADGIRGNVFQKPLKNEYYFKETLKYPISHYYDNFENCVNALHYFETTKKISEVGYLFNLI